MEPITINRGRNNDDAFSLDALLQERCSSALSHCHEEGRGVSDKRLSFTQNGIVVKPKWNRFPTGKNQPGPFGGDNLSRLFAERESRLSPMEDLGAANKPRQPEETIGIPCDEMPRSSSTPEARGLPLLRQGGEQLRRHRDQVGLIGRFSAPDRNEVELPYQWSEGLKLKRVQRLTSEDRHAGPIHRSLA